MRRVIPALVASLLLAGCAASSHGNSTKFSPYVALGDSYTAAPYIPSPQGGSCFRSTHNYPYLVANELHIARLLDRSCGGAQTKDLAGSQRLGVGPQFSALTDRTKLVTVGIGANDLGIAAALIVECPALRAKDPTGAPCRDANDHNGTNELLAAMPTVTARIVAVLRQIHARSPRARVLVVGYPQIVPAKGSCAAYPVASGDFAYARQINIAMNAAIQTAAATTGDTFIDIWKASQGHDICSADPWINGSTVRTQYAAPYHPLEPEQQEVATLIVAALQSGTTA